MSEKKSRPPKRDESSPSFDGASSRPGPGDELRTQRTSFVSTFFKKGAELTDEAARVL